MGSICHDVGDPYFAGIIGGVVRTAAEHVQVILGSTFRQPDREVGYVSMMRGQRARAILLIGSGFEDPAWRQRMRDELDRYASVGGRAAVVSRHRAGRPAPVPPRSVACS